MRDYVSNIFDVFRVKSEAILKEDVSDIDNLIATLTQFQMDFEQKVMNAAGFLINNAHYDNPKLGDKDNPMLASLARIREAIEQSISYLRTLKQDPLANEDEMGLSNTGADIPNMPDLNVPDMSGDIGSIGAGEIEESNRYYNQMNPDKVNPDEVLKLNGWNYANGEIWDDQGICSISYDKDNDCIHVTELLDPDGIEQETIADVHSVEELDNVLTQFVELDELASEMKQAFAEYVEQQRGIETDEAAELPPVASEPTIIDEWEYLVNDPEFNDNSTLLYDKGNVVVFIQKDADSENSQPYYVNALSGNENTEYQTASLDDLCKWLEVNELPVPTEDAKQALKGEVAESVSEAKEDKDCCKKLPKGMKCAKDDPSITTLAKEVEDPKVAKIEEPKK